MNRRERILGGMGATGGTQAPRRKQILEGLQSSTTLPAGGLPPRRYPAQEGPPRQPRQGAPLRQPVNLGKQLQGRVQSGAIDPAQAQKTARQRQLLKKAFGSNWRSQVFAGSGVKEIRQGGPFANRQIAAERAKGLERAKRKLY